MENIFVEFLPPWIETGLQPAFYDKESGTVLQQTARMYARVNMLIRMFNKLSKNTKTTVEDYINKFNELHDYVQDYFDNLDVQEEINNKLDDMAEDGQLSDLIAQYIGLGALVTFNTQADMIASVNLSNGTKCKTLGKDTKGDGFGAYYTISTTGDIALDNGLYATLVPNFGGNNYYDEITSEKLRANSSDYYLTTIPLNDSDNNMIKLYIGQAQDVNETPLKYAQRNHTSFTCNATLNYGGSFGVGSVIANGEIIRSVDPTIQSHSGYRYVGIKADRSFVDYQANQTTAQQMLNDGCEQAWFVYFKMISGGVILDLSNVDIGGDNIVAGKHPRQCLGVKSDGTVLILTVDGRTPRNVGMTALECANILYNAGCINAWCMDGGGSSSTEIKGCKINRNVDGNGTQDRWIEFTLNAKKETIDEELANCYSQIGKEKQQLLAMVTETINSVSQVQYLNAGDLNNESVYLKYALAHSCSNSPSSIDGYFINIPHPQSQWVGLYATQLYMVRDNSTIFRRELIDGVWSEWMRVGGNIINFYNGNYTLTLSGAYELIPIKTTETATNNNALITYVNEDEDHLATKFKLNITGTHTIKLKANCVVVPSGSDGYRYITFRRGSTNKLAGSTRNKLTASKDEAIFTETIYTDVTSSNEFSLAINGTAGDSIERINIFVEVY